MRTQQIAALLIIITLFACNRSNIRSQNDFKETQDSDVVIQVMKLNDSIPDTSVLKYGVRIFPSKKMAKILTDKSKENLWYKMDSSFYLQSGPLKVYASLTEPISNGQKNNFEYLLIFEKTSRLSPNDLKLAFNDQYISHKTHYFQLNAQ